MNIGIVQLDQFILTHRFGVGNTQGVIALPVLLFIDLVLNKGIVNSAIRKEKFVIGKSGSIARAVPGLIVPSQRDRPAHSFKFVPEQ